MVGAVGHTILKWLGLLCARVEAQPCPVSPRPCKKMSVAVCLPLALITTRSDMADLEARSPIKASRVKPQCPGLGKGSKLATREAAQDYNKR